MSKMFFKASLGLLVLAGMAGPLSAALPADKILHGHVPSVVASLAKTGDVADTNELNLAIGLQLRNQAALDDLIHQVNDPASANYQHYLTADEFTAQFAPTEADYQAVVAFAKAQGLTVTATSSNRMLVEVKGQSKNVKKAFKVSLHTYTHPSEHRTFFAPDSEPSVPANLAILDVSGLNNYSRPYNHVHVRSNGTNAPANTVPQTGSGDFGSYMGNDFRAAYVPGATQTGTGQNVALVQFDGYFPSDIQLYEAMNNLPNVPLQDIHLNGFNGFPVTFNGNLEVSLDIEMVISMAPGVNKILLYEGDPFNFFPNVVLNQIAQDNSSRQISCSWGWTGGPNATSDQIFKEMIVQGQTFYDASGDNDAFLPGQVDNPSLPGFPSDDPYITQVGATTLTTTGPGGAYVSETVWNWGVELGLGFDGEGSAGGISSFYTIPTWQTNVSMTANGGSITFRNLPDVAMVGDNVFVIAAGGAHINGVGGTSCASPLWAGFTALVNQQAAANGHTSVGFINPTLYALAKGPFYSGVFNDITTGSNTWSLSPNLFVAVTNYDLCTGLGSPKLSLLSALTSVTNVQLGISGLIPSPQQPWGTTLTAMNGSNPNGLWLLYYRDMNQTLGGTNINGWVLNLTTANPVGQNSDNQLYVNTTINSQPYGNATNVIATPGSSWHTTFAVTNYGPSLSSNVFVADTLPQSPGVTLVSSSATLGTITNFGGTLVWTLGNLAVNAGGTMTVNFQANTSGVYTNFATVGSLTIDPNSDDDTTTVIATVAATTPPAIVPNLAVGGNHGFQLSITNDAGSSVIIQASTNLITWVPICTNVAPFTFTNLDSTNYQKRFYRALIGQ